MWNTIDGRTLFDNAINDDDSMLDLFSSWIAAAGTDQKSSLITLNQLMIAATKTCKAIAEFWLDLLALMTIYFPPRKWNRWVLRVRYVRIIITHTRSFITYLSFWSIQCEWMLRKYCTFLYKSIWRYLNFRAKIQTILNFLIFTKLLSQHFPAV